MSANEKVRDLKSNIYEFGGICANERERDLKSNIYEIGGVCF